jgi:acyl-CoA synthetase (AMP-forming)/AMP-acid ligase II
MPSMHAHARQRAAHAGGISSALAAVAAGAQHAFLPRFSAAGLVAVVAQHRVSALIAVPTMLQDLAALLAQPQHAALQLQTVRRVLVGAGGVPVATLSALAPRMPAACILSAYGMTEAASSITFDTLAVRGRDAGACMPCMREVRTAGAAADVPPGVQASARSWPVRQCAQVPRTLRLHTLRALGGRPRGCWWRCRRLTTAATTKMSETLATQRRCGARPPPRCRRCGRAPPAFMHSAGASAACMQVTTRPHAVGEVVIQGPAVASGYWGVGAAPRAGAWFRTGDLGWFDAHGRLWLAGRRKDMIKSGGENIHTSEVEAAVAALPAVAEAAALGVPHTRLGEAVAVLVSVHRGSPAAQWPPVAAATGGATPAALQPAELQWLQAQLRGDGLSAFKLPRVAVWAAAPLPRGATGKVDKRAVRDLVAAATGGATPRSAL